VQCKKTQNRYIHLHTQGQEHSVKF